MTENEAKYFFWNGKIGLLYPVQQVWLILSIFPPESSGLILILLDFEFLWKSSSKARRENDMNKLLTLHIDWHSQTNQQNFHHFLFWAVEKVHLLQFLLDWNKKIPEIKYLKIK